MYPGTLYPSNDEHVNSLKISWGDEATGASNAQAVSLPDIERCNIPQKEPRSFFRK